MIVAIEKDGSDLIHQANSVGYVLHEDTRGYTSSIDLSQDLTYNLVLGYDPARRLKVVRRWMELEGAAQQGAPTPHFHIPTTLAEALRLAADKSEECERLSVTTPGA